MGPWLRCTERTAYLVTPAARSPNWMLLASTIFPNEDVQSRLSSFRRIGRDRCGRHIGTRPTGAAPVCALTANCPRWRPTTHTMMRRNILTTIALLLVVAACGGAAPEATSAPAPASTSRSDLPSVDVLDVVTGESVDVSSLAPLDTPLLIWFYAPH